MYLLPLPELTLNPEFEERLMHNICNLPDAAWTTTPSGLTQLAEVLGVELEMFRNKFTKEANALIAGFRYFRIFPKTTLPTHKDKTRNSVLFFTLNPKIDHVLNFKNGRRGETILSFRYSNVPTLVDVKMWHEAVNNSSEYRMAIIAYSNYMDGGFDELEELYRSQLLLSCQDPPGSVYKFPWHNEDREGYTDE
jgi:hypothetical protein